MSSTVDVDIAKMMIQRGLLKPDQMIVCNGFKGAGSQYAANLLQLRPLHTNLIPVIEDLGEISPLMRSGHQFNVGLRMKSYGRNLTEEEMNTANSRFGFSKDTIWKAADYSAAAPNLNLVMYHNMVGSQLDDPEEFVARLKPGMEVLARLR